MNRTARWSAASLCAALCGSLSAGPAEATVVRGLSLAEKTQAADLVVQATALSMNTHWVIEGGSAETRIELRVDRAIKGKIGVGAHLSLVQPGGTIGEFTHRIPGMSSWREGEQAILFLEKLPGGGYVEIGVGIGKYAIEPGAGGPVVTHAPQVALAVRAPGQTMRVEEARPMAPMKLGAFLTEVARLAKASAARPTLPSAAPKGTPARSTKR